MDNIFTMVNMHVFPNFLAFNREARRFWPPPTPWAESSRHSRVGALPRSLGAKNVFLVREGQPDRSLARSAPAVRAAVRGDGPLPIFLLFSPPKLRHSNTSITESKCAPLQNQTVTYGTVPWGGDLPGTSCQATIALSLRDKSHSPVGNLAIS